MPKRKPRWNPSSTIPAAKSRHGGMVLIESGNPAKARQALSGILREHEPTTLMALNVLDWMHTVITLFIPP